MREFKFIKMHGLGNDFVYLDGLDENLPRIDLHKLALSICNRQTGVGADGLILILPSRTCDFRMRIFNADGGEAEMCGNGFRGLIRYLHDRGYTKKRTIQVETLAGTISGEIVRSRKKEPLVKVAMGIPEFRCNKIDVDTTHKEIIERKIRIKSQDYTITVVSMGNPHAVLFVPDFKFDWQTAGRDIENYKLFPKRTNVEFVQILNRRKIIVHSWERGVGPTMASGTGASAAVSSGIRCGYLDDSVEVFYDLGSMIIEWKNRERDLYKTGPAEYSFTGIYKY